MRASPSRDDTPYYVVIDRSLRIAGASPAFISSVRDGDPGRAFLQTISPDARATVRALLTRVAAGTTTMGHVPHLARSEDAVLPARYRFGPLEGSGVLGLGEPDRGAQRDCGTRLLRPLALYERLAAEWGRCERYGLGLSVVLIDMTPGPGAHPQRVRRLRCSAARRLVANIRLSDVLGRCVRNRLAVIAPHADAAGGRVLRDRLANALATEPATRGAVQLRIGCASMGDERVEILEDLWLVAEADLRDAA